MSPSAVTVIRILAGGAVGGAVFALVFPERRDYPGHYLAGFGGTLLLLAFPLALLTPVLRWEPVGTALVAIALGAVLEATIFGLACFDTVDFANQSVGAVLAAASVTGRPGSLATAFSAGVLALAFLSAGTVYAFS